MKDLKIRFKIGDRVEVVRSSGFIGLVGTVVNVKIDNATNKILVEIYPDNKSYLEKFDTGRGSIVLYDYKLSLLETSPLLEWLDIRLKS